MKKILTKVCVLIYNSKIPDTFQKNRNLILTFDHNKDETKFLDLKMKSTTLVNEKIEAILLQSDILSEDITDIKSIQNNFAISSLLMNSDDDYDHVGDYLDYFFGLKVNLKINKSYPIKTYSICSEIMDCNNNMLKFRITCHVRHEE
jgi:hypothetical protein